MVDAAMSDEELRDMVEMFGEKLPDPDHNPIQFRFYILLYKKLKEWSQTNG